MTTVLVVDEEPAILRALRAGLEARGYRVEAAATCGRAIERIAAERFDVVLLDLGLPDDDGVHVVQRVREWSDVPIIVLTADGHEQRKIVALDEGADDYILKPFSMPELLARIRVALRHRARPAPRSTSRCSRWATSAWTSPTTRARSRDATSTSPRRSSPCWRCWRAGRARS